MKKVGYILKIILLVVLIVISFSSCKRYLPGFKSNPYAQACDIEGKYGVLNNYGVPEYLDNIKTKISRKLQLPENMKVALLAESVDGGAGVYELRIIFFNENDIKSVLVLYEFIDEKASIKKVLLGDVKKKEHRKIVGIYHEMLEFGNWNIFIKCVSLTNEQEIIFYIKEGLTYHYFAKFENYNFHENPSIGIDKEIIYIIKKLKEI